MNIIWDILCILIILGILIFLSGALMVYLFFVRRNPIGDRYLEREQSQKGDQYDKYFKETLEGISRFEKAKKEDLSIESFDGLKLKAYLWEAEKPTDKTLILVHGYRGYGCYEFGARLDFFRSLGWNMLLVDDRAHGRSEGRYIGFGNLDVYDLQNWIDLMVERYGKDSKIVLHGVSMGGATVLATAGQPDCSSAVKGVVDDCGFSSGYEEVKWLFGSWIKLPHFPFMNVSCLWHKWLTGYDVRKNAAVDLIPNFKGKLLVIHGGADNFVPTFMGQDIFNAATCDKDIFIAPGAEHVMSYTVCPDEYRARFKAFLENI